MKHLLVVEDDVDVREALTVGLGFTFEVTATGTARDAIALATAREFHAIVLDLQLPDLRGEDVLLELDQRRIRTPVLLISAHGHVALAACARRFRVAAVVPKPFGLETLEARLEAITSRPPPPTRSTGPST